MAEDRLNSVLNLHSDEKDAKKDEKEHDLSNIVSFTKLHSQVQQGQTKNHIIQHNNTRFSNVHRTHHSIN